MRITLKTIEELGILIRFHIHNIDEQNICFIPGIIATLKDAIAK